MGMVVREVVIIVTVVVAVMVAGDDNDSDSGDGNNSHGGDHRLDGKRPPLWPSASKASPNLTPAMTFPFYN